MSWAILSQMVEWHQNRNPQVASPETPYDMVNMGIYPLCKALYWHLWLRGCRRSGSLEGEFSMSAGVPTGRVVVVVSWPPGRKFERLPVGARAAAPEAPRVTTRLAIACGAVRRMLLAGPEFKTGIPVRYSPTACPDVGQPRRSDDLISRRTLLGPSLEHGTLALTSTGAGPSMYSVSGSVSLGGRLEMPQM